MWFSDTVFMSEEESPQWHNFPDSTKIFDKIISGMRPFSGYAELVSSGLFQSCGYTETLCVHRNLLNLAILYKTIRTD